MSRGSNLAESIDNRSMEKQIPDFVAQPDTDYYWTPNFLVLDFEIDTSHGDYGHPVHPDNGMLLACWNLGPHHPAFEDEDKVYYLWANEYGLALLLEHLNAADLLVAHNAKYELGWLLRCGFDISTILVYCTKIGEYVLRGNLKHISTSLDACCRRRKWVAKDPVVDHMMSRGVNPTEIPRPWLLGRCVQDVLSTRDLFFDQRGDLESSDRLALVYTRCLLSPVLAEMEMEGMALDPELVYAEHAEMSARLSALEVELQRLADINWNSDLQVAEYVYEKLGFEELTNKKGEPIRTDGGKPKTDKDTLAALQAHTPEQKSFKEVYQEYNAVSSRLSKYLDFYYAVCKQQGGVFSATFNQTTTKTHRLSSSGMRIPFEHREGKSGGTQFQNQPREYKKFFCAKRPGHLFTEEDGSGLEFRVAGLVGNDQQIKDDINNPDFDPHYQSAMVMGGYDSYDQVTKEERTAAKADTFKPLFGGESGTKHQKRYYEAFKKRYSGLAQTQEKWLYEALNTKRLVLPWGMQFFYPHIKMDNSGYVNERTKIFNGPIQSFATAEIIPIQAVYLYHYLKVNPHVEAYLVNTVHDSVLAEVHPESLQEYTKLVVDSWGQVFHYVEDMYGMQLEGMPLGTEISSGTHWGTPDHEEAYNIWIDKVEVA